MQPSTGLTEDHRDPVKREKEEDDRDFLTTCKTRELAHGSGDTGEADATAS